MRTLVLEEPGRLRLADAAEPPAPGPGEAVVRVRRVGVCGTDLHAFRGEQPFFTYPRILGHELAVEVVDAGPDGRGLAEGDRCTVEPYLHCGRCVACRRGRPNCCAHLQVLGVHTDGGLRPLLTVPVEKLHRAPEIPLDVLAVVEMLCIGAHAVRRAGPEAGEHVLVIGAGPIGLSVAALARLAGARVSVVELNPHRLAFAGARLDLEAALADPADAQAAGATIVFDATGSLASMTRAFDYLPPTGTLVLVGLAQGDLTFHDPDFHRRELTLMSSRNAAPRDFAHVLDLLASGRLDPSPWITHRLPFEEAAGRFEELFDPDREVVKALVEL